MCSLLAGDVNRAPYLVVDHPSDGDNGEIPPKRQVNSCVLLCWLTRSDLRIPARRWRTAGAVGPELGDAPRVPASGAARRRAPSPWHRMVASLSQGRDPVRMASLPDLSCCCALAAGVVERRIVHSATAGECRPPSRGLAHEQSKFCRSACGGGMGWHATCLVATPLEPWCCCGATEGRSPWGWDRDRFCDGRVRTWMGRLSRGSAIIPTLDALRDRWDPAAGHRREGEGWSGRARAAESPSSLRDLVRGGLLSTRPRRQRRRRMCSVKIGAGMAQARRIRHLMVAVGTWRLVSVPARRVRPRTGCTVGRRQARLLDGPSQAAAARKHGPLH
ncbi:hypothetical protein QBC39DRAFT_173075 [Podospora conica]|nr:hypothetical protein QBC39DRAFT_173075 [Schizothecium conicum]